MMEKTCNHKLLLILLSISSLLFCFPGSSTCQVHPPAAPPPAVDQLCEKTTGPFLCISAFAYFPSGLMDSPTAILATMVNATLITTQAAQAEATRLLSDPSFRYKGYVQICQGKFSPAIKELQIALQAIADGDDQLLVDALNEAKGEFNACVTIYPPLRPFTEFGYFPYGYGYYDSTDHVDYINKFNVCDRLAVMVDNCLDIRKAINPSPY